MGKGLPTRAWRPRHTKAMQRELQRELDGLAEFLARPEFPNGIYLGRGVADTTDPDTGEPTFAPLTHVTADSFSQAPPVEGEDPPPVVVDPSLPAWVPRGRIASSSRQASVTVSGATPQVLHQVSAMTEQGRLYRISGSVWRVTPFDSQAMWDARIRDHLNDVTLFGQSFRAPSWGATPWALFVGDGMAHVFSLVVQRTSGTSDALVEAHPTSPARIMVEDLGTA